MSKFSGRCDFCDEIEIFGLDFILRSKVYLGNTSVPLELNCLADCIPYYPYVVASGGYNIKDGYGTLYLAAESETERRSKYDPDGAARYRALLDEEIQKNKTKSTEITI